MTLSDIRDWLKTLELAEHYSIGRLDNRQERSLGVYDRAGGGMPVTALGGAGLSSYDLRRVTLLLHWNRNARETEAAARRLWEAVAFASGIDLPGGHIQFIRPAVPAPVPVGTDKGGVYEYRLELDICYRR